MYRIKALPYVTWWLVGNRCSLILLEASIMELDGGLHDRGFCHLSIGPSTRNHDH